MKSLRTSPAIDPFLLSPAQRDQLANELYTVHRLIFDGVDRMDFRRYVIEPPSFRSRIYRFLNGKGTTVGYISFHHYKLENGRKVRHLFRTEVGLLPAYRGHNSAASLLFRESLKAWFRVGCTNAWFVATPIHPNPFAIAGRHVVDIYPHPKRELPWHMHAFMREVSAGLGLKNGQQNLPLQKRVGWITRQTPQQRAALLQSSCPWTQFYLTQNPEYEEGNGMLMLIPFSLRNGLAMLWRFARRKQRKRSFTCDKDSHLAPELA